MRVSTLQLMFSSRLAMVTVDSTLRIAASAFSNRQVGLLVVCDGNRRAAGVVSKSDLVRHLTEAGLVEAPVAALMSRTIVSCRPEDDLYATWQKMGAQSLQNIPVLSTDATPIGVLDIRDALKALLEQEEYQERLLRNYVAGVGYQ